MQIDKLVYIVKSILKRLDILERKNNSVLVARINLLEERIERLEKQKQ